MPGSTEISSSTDLFGDDALIDPYPLYKELRDLGPVVWLPHTMDGVWAVTRHDGVHAVLDDQRTYSRVDGFTLTGPRRRTAPAATPSPPAGTGRSLTPDSALTAPRVAADTVRGRADLLVTECVGHGRFDAAELARRLVTDVLPTVSGATAATADRTTPTPDLTALAVSTTILRLATHPEQWALLRAGRARGDAAFHETLRIDAPVRLLGRRAVRDTVVEGTGIKSGERMLLLCGSAGRDPRKWGHTADRYQILRSASADHLSLHDDPYSRGWNNEARTALAAWSVLVARAVLGSLASRCIRLATAGAPVPVRDPLLRGFDRVPVQVVADRRRILH